MFKTRSRLVITALLLCTYVTPSAWAQTPSPLPEWQYSAGIILSKLFEPDLPDWFRVVGVAVETQPVYAGAAAYEVQAGPAITILYKDIAFISTGDGIGVNFWRGEHYRIGAAIAYDLGRRESEDYANLRGMGDISPAPAAKLFASYVLSKKFPLVLRLDARQILGGVNGTVGDVGFYLPLPGSSRKFVMFAGPTATFATHRYLQSEFGVTLPQSRASGHPVFTTHTGIESVGAGFNATRFLWAHWLVNVDLGISKFKGSAQASPLTENTLQREAAVSFDYQW